MEAMSSRTTRTLHFVILISALAVIVIGLSALTILTAHAAAAAPDAPTRKLLLRLAWLSLVLLAMTLVLLLWAAMRLVRSRIRFSKGPTTTPYVDAWSLAGKRFKLEDDGEDRDADGQNDTEARDA